MVSPRLKLFNANSTTLNNYAFSFFPISLILGSYVINLNVVLFCFLGIFSLRSKILNTKLDFSIKIAFLFFFIVFFSTLVSFLKSLYFDGYEYDSLERLIKSVTFFRFFLMLLIVVLLKKFNLLNFKYFFVVAALSSIVVSFDVIYQYIFGVNITGLKSIAHYNSGFFGDELMAGGYIMKFSFFSIFLITFLLKNKNKLRFSLSVVLMCFLGISILFSGNRMPMILFLFGLLLIFFFDDKLRKIIATSFLTIILLAKFISLSDPQITTMYSSYYSNVTNLITSIVNNSKNKKISESAQEKTEKVIVDDFYSFWQPTDETAGYKKLFLTALDTWKANKVFGNGIKSFRVDCIELRDHKKNRLCSNHPHNYYLEILTETGIVGFVFVIITILSFFVFILKNLNSFKQNDLESFIFIPSVINLILEIFPFRSTGSLLTTNNAIYFILILAIVLSYKKNLLKTNHGQDV